MAPALPAPTARLVLRPWRDRDLDAFAAMNADPEVMRHFPSLHTREESWKQLQWLRLQQQAQGHTVWPVELPGICAFAGMVGLLRVDFEAHFTPAVEIGWRMDRPFWNQGLATEAARAVLEFGFTNLGLAEVVAFTTPGNAASLRVMDKLGMCRDPADDFEHPKLPPGHPLRPHLLYRARRA